MTNEEKTEKIQRLTRKYLQGMITEQELYASAEDEGITRDEINANLLGEVKENSITKAEINAVLPFPVWSFQLTSQLNWRRYDRRRHNRER